MSGPTARPGVTALHLPFHKEIAPEECCRKPTWLAFIRLAQAGFENAWWIKLLRSPVRGRAAFLDPARAET